MKTSNKLLLGLLVVVILAITVFMVLLRFNSSSSGNKSQNDLESSACTIQLPEDETNSYILSFQFSENTGSTNENKAEVSTFSFENKIGGKSIKRYKCTGKLLEIYRLLSQNIPQSEFILSDTLTAEQTSLLARSFDLEIKTIHSPETAKEIFRKLDAVSGLQTDISEIDTAMFILKEIKESNHLKKTRNFLKREFTVGNMNDSKSVNGKMSSEDWLSLIKKEINEFVSMDKSLENNFYRAKNLTFKTDSNSIEQQLIFFKEAGLLIERELGTITIINVR